MAETQKKLTKGATTPPSSTSPKRNTRKDLDDHDNGKNKSKQNKRKRNETANEINFKAQTLAGNNANKNVETSDANQKTNDDMLKSDNTISNKNSIFYLGICCFFCNHLTTNFLSTG